MNDTKATAPNTPPSGHGTRMVPKHVKDQRRKRNKRARASRRINRRAGAR